MLSCQLHVFQWAWAYRWTIRHESIVGLISSGIVTSAEKEGDETGCGHRGSVPGSRQPSAELRHTEHPGGGEDQHESLHDQQVSHVKHIRCVKYCQLRLSAAALTTCDSLVSSVLVKDISLAPISVICLLAVSLMYTCCTPAGASWWMLLSRGSRSRRTSRTLRTHTASRSVTGPGHD